MLLLATSFPGSLLPEQFHPAAANLIVFLYVVIYAFWSSSVTNNYSSVDRLWSLIPIVYTWVNVIGLYLATESIDVRTLVVALLVTVWGVRLTYNFWRKGGYSAGEQDYRWPIIQKKFPSRFLWHIFNLLFISFYQHLLLLLLSLPSYLAYNAAVSAPAEWSRADTLSTIFALLAVLLETLADNEQSAFQTKKYELLKKKKVLSALPLPYSNGFLSSGLFALSRHPNVFAEASFWWALSGFACHLPVSSVSVNQYMNVPFWMGALLLNILVVSSSIFTESISASKYPLYKKYQQTTSFLIPWIPGPSVNQKK